jgi:EAL domain-containing protein (putative c-di-GMP-specific phosphodiesterase class I)
VFADVAAALQASSLPPNYLLLQITESLLLDCRVETMDHFGILRAWSVGLAIGDFCIGSSSLSCLQRCLFDKLGITLAFTQNADEGVEAIAPVCVILAMAHKLMTEDTGG